MRANPHLTSPYFSVHFTLAVASVRDDVRVVVMEDDSQVVGYFPFQHGRLGWGRPVGGPFSDQHGVIAAPDADFDVRALLRAARLTSWEFDHLLAVQAPFAPFETTRTTSPILDLTDGFDAYARARQEAGSQRIKQIERKARKFEREVGPLSWAPHSSSLKELDRVFSVKSEQCRTANIPDVFGSPWSRELVRTILETNERELTGCLSTLYVGEELVAAHAGMRSDRSWHWWFPVYDQRYAKYSPGLILLLEVAREASRLGLDHVDLGKGDDFYKQSFKNAEIELSEGCATRPSLGNVARSAREQAETMLRRSHLADPVRSELRRANQWLRQRRFR
jgi:CelD/BcsL family acetyltransferase involved in cellulose biosynthesis